MFLNRVCIFQVANILTSPITNIHKHENFWLLTATKFVIPTKITSIGFLSNMENLALSKRTNPDIFIKKSNYSQTTFLIKKKK